MDVYYKLKEIVESDSFYSKFDVKVSSHRIILIKNVIEIKIENELSCYPHPQINAVGSPVYYNGVLIGDISIAEYSNIYNILDPTKKAKEAFYKL